MDKPNGWWVTGMIDGEGSFVAGLYEQRGREQLQIQFRLAQRADDWGVGALLVRYFGCGKMHLEDRVQPNPRYIFQLASKPELRVLIDHLAQFPLQSKKRLDSDIWVALAEVYLASRGGWGERKEWVRQECLRLQEVRAFDPSVVGQAEQKLGAELFRGGRKTWRLFDRRCSVEGCNRKHFGLGFCNKHYKREKRRVAAAV